MNAFFIQLIQEFEFFCIVEYKKIYYITRKSLFCFFGFYFKKLNTLTTENILKIFYKQNKKHDI